MDQHWYYADRQRRQQGPVEAAALRDLYRRGAVDAGSLVWHEGLPDWQPLSRHLDALGIADPGPAPPPSLPPPPPEPAVAAATVMQAGFLRRFAAFVIDSLVLAVGFYAVLAVLVLAIIAAGGFANWDENHLPGWLVLAYFLVVLGYYVAAAFYYALQESGRHQATLGKRALGIKVTDSFGQRLDFGQALLRWFAAVASYLTLYVGFLMAAFTERKQALHDLIVGTFVVDRWAYTDTPEKQRSHGPGCLVAIVAAAALLVPGLGILAAIAIPAYQDYTVRAKVAEAVAATAPAKRQMQDFIANTDRCPRDAQEIGLPPITSEYVRSLEAGEIEGRCALELELGGFGPAHELDGKRIWLELQDDGRWRCSSDAPSKVLPAGCR